MEDKTPEHIKEWKLQEKETLIKLIKKSKNTTPLSRLFPELGLSPVNLYTLANISRFPGRDIVTLSSDLLPMFKILLIPIYRRINEKHFRAVYGITPNELIDLLENYSDFMLPIATAPPHAYSSPKFYDNLLNRLYDIYGFYPPHGWGRITYYLSHKLEFPWEYFDREFYGKIKKIVTLNRRGLLDLANNIKRHPNEVIRMTTTRLLQLKLFGLDNVVNLILDLSEKTMNPQLLYFLSRVYHKYLLSPILDYIGGVTNLEPGSISDLSKLGILSNKEYEILRDTYLLPYRLGIFKRYSNYPIILDVTMNTRNKLKILERAIKLREECHDLNRTFGKVLQNAWKGDIHSLFNTYRKLDENFRSYIEYKTQELEKKSLFS